MSDTVGMEKVHEETHVCPLKSQIYKEKTTKQY